MRNGQVSKTFRKELRVTRNEKLAIVGWGVFLIVAALGQIAYWLGFNVPIGYLIYESDTGYTGGIFIMVMIFWPIFGIYKISKFEEKMIRQRKIGQKTHKPNFKA